MMRWRNALILGLMMVLAACSARGTFSYLPLPAAQNEEIEKIYVATNRNSYVVDDLELVRQQFGDRRTPDVRFGRVDISIPPVHELGQIEWPKGGRPDAAKHFVVRAGTSYDSAGAFRRAFRAERGPGRDKVFLFVHGFNVNISEALYRLAQMSHDFEADVPAVAYSWASAGDPKGYVYDRDSVMFSRDGLESVIELLVNDGWDINLVAHSMGSQLVMETLRQMSIAGKHRVLHGVKDLVLVSPDIDEDVFVQQAKRIKPLPQSTTLLVSTRDRALGLSAVLTGKQGRLGSIRDKSLLDGLPVEVVDLSDIKGGDRGAHSTAFTSPVAIRLLRRMHRRAMALVGQ